MHFLLNKYVSNFIRTFLHKSSFINKKILKSIIILLYIIIVSFILKSKHIHNNQLFNYNSSIDKKNEKEKFFFMKEKGQLKLCKYYGIFIYNYPLMRPRPFLGNIGDYIQSLAALQYLPKNCIPFFVDRDQIELFNNSVSNIILIMNSWNIIKRGNRKVSDKIHPIYISYHINNINDLNIISINNLKKYEPIGCRDKYTQENLEKKGIITYFSSCLTTTLDIDFAAKDSQRTNEIIFIDFKFGIFPKADKFIKSLKKYDFTKVTHINHLYILKKKSHIERFKFAKQLLDKYSRAKLVISTRLHGALPCLALNTPIIFVNKKYDIRYPGLYELLNTIGINSKGNFEINVKLNKDNKVINPKKYIKYANILKEKLKDLSKKPIL